MFAENTQNAHNGHHYQPNFPLCHYITYKPVSSNYAQDWVKSGKGKGCVCWLVQQPTTL